MSGDGYEAYLNRLHEALKPVMTAEMEAFNRLYEHYRRSSPLRFFPFEREAPQEYTGPDLFDVAPPGVHALLAYRNVHRNTCVLDGTPLAVQP